MLSNRPNNGKWKIGSGKAMSGEKSSSLFEQAVRSNAMPVKANTSLIVFIIVELSCLAGS